MQSSVSLQTPDRMADLLQSFEKLYLLHPKVFNRQHDTKYWTTCIVIIVITVFCSLRFIIGAFYPNIGYVLGNYLNVLGVAGQVMSLGAGICSILIPYFRIRLLQQKDRLSFIYDLIA